MSNDKKKPKGKKKTMPTIIRTQSGEIVHCPHEWRKLETATRDFTDHCIGCGAGASFDLRGKVVAYDRDWQDGKVRHAERYDVPPDASNEPITWSAQESAVA